MKNSFITRISLSFGAVISAIYFTACCCPCADPNLCLGGLSLFSSALSSSRTSSSTSRDSANNTSVNSFVGAENEVAFASASISDENTLDDNDATKEDILY